MATHPKKAKGRRHPWSGYSVKTDKRGHQKWQYRLVNKFAVTVFTSAADNTTQKDARIAGKAHKDERTAADAAREEKHIAADACTPRRRNTFGHGALKPGMPDKSIVIP